MIDFPSSPTNGQTYTSNNVTYTWVTAKSQWQASANGFYYIGTTANYFGRASGAQTLTGVSIDGNAVTVGGLAVATGRNNVANQVARTDANGYLQTGYINSSNGDEGNASSPSRVWGTNGSDSYLRTYLTTSLSVGSATTSTTQALTLANTVYPITMNTTDIANGFSRGSTTSQIIAANAGLYNFQFSLQIRSSTSAQRSVFIWPRVNGNNVANSAAEVTIKSNTDVIVASWNFVISLTAGQYFELVAATDGTGITLASSASQSTPYVRPAIPSIILAVTQVNQ